MKRPPNAILHMSIGGFRAFAVRGGLFIFVIAMIAELTVSSTPLQEALPLLVLGSMVGAFVCGLLGLLIGALAGYAIDWQVRRVELPISQDDLQSLRQQIQPILVIIAGFGTVIMMSILLRTVTLVGLVPAVPAYRALRRVSQRYLNKLEVWREPKVKSKEKNKEKRGYAL